MADVLEIFVLTNKSVERAYTADELAERATADAAAAAAEQAAADAAAAVASGRAKLAALGLTDAEIAALLGA